MSINVRNGMADAMDRVEQELLELGYTRVLRSTAMLETKRQRMADYHFRENARDGFDIDPLNIITRIRWTEEAECHFMLEPPAAGEVLSLAWRSAAALIGLRTERSNTPMQGD